MSEKAPSFLLLDAIQAYGNRSMKLDPVRARPKRPTTIRLNPKFHIDLLGDKHAFKYGLYTFDDIRRFDGIPVTFTDTIDQYELV